jgi:hypothetical protein
MSKNEYKKNDKVIIPSGDECTIVDAFTNGSVDNTLYMVQLFSGAVKGPYKSNQLTKNNEEWR